MWKVPKPENLFKETFDKRGYVRIWLGKGHYLANSAGWQYKHRFMMSVHLGRELRQDEHVHHCNKIYSDNRFENFQLWLAEFHGKYHGRINVVGAWRDDVGKFISYIDIDSIDEVPF